MAALFAEDIRHLVAVVGGEHQLFGEGRIEVGDDLVPVGAVLFDAVEHVFHPGGEADVHDVGKVLAQKVGDAEGDLGGHHVLAFLSHIFAAGEHGDDGGIGRRPADALFFHRLDEGSIGIAQRGLGELLLGGEGNKVYLFPFFEVRQQLGVDALFVFLLLLHVLIHGGEAREFERSAAGFEAVIAVFDLHLHAVVLRLAHLRCQKALVNELVHVVVLFIEDALDAFGRALQIDGADALVRVLRALFCFIEVGLGGHIFFAELFGDEGARRRLRFRRNAHGVGTDIGDEGDMALFGGVHALVQVLRHLHDLGRGHAEFIGSVLLQGRRGEGRGRVRLC